MPTAPRHTRLCRAVIALALACALTAAACGGARSPFRTPPEYEEEIYLSLDGSATVTVNASVASLVALRGVSLDVDPQGRVISLSTLVTVTDTVGPQYTNRFNLLRSAEVSGTPAKGYSSAQTLKALEETIASSLPREMGYTWSNLSYQEKAAEGKGGIVFVMALIFVFFILAAQYESWTLPFSVLLGTPWAIMGAMLGL